MTAMGTLASYGITQDETMNGMVLNEVDQFRCLGSTVNQIRNIGKGSTDQAGASTLGHDKAGNTIEEQSHLCLVTTVLWM